MALRQIRVGSLENVHQYDDGDFDKSISVEDPISCSATPLAGSDVVRLDDLTDIFFAPESVVNIASPTELNGVVGKEGSLIIAYKINAALVQDEWTIYAYDDSGPAVNMPYVVDAAGVGNQRWIAVGGKYSVFTAHTIASHSDANLGAIANNDLMQWDDPSTEWLPKSIAEVILNQAIAPGPVTIGTVETWDYAAAIADDGTKALPTILANYAAKVEVIVSSAGIIDANATFMIDSTGTVTPQVDSGNCVYNTDTDVKLCIGTAAAQNPLTIKYRLGSAVAKIMINMKYVKA